MDVKSREEIIKFAQKLNSTNLSPLRSGNISLKAQNNNEEGFLITPSGKKYDSLKVDIWSCGVIMCLCFLVVVTTSMVCVSVRKSVCGIKRCA